MAYGARRKGKGKKNIRGRYKGKAHGVRHKA